ncbi:MAG: formylglycine-generating enzyme family protein, partial [Chitinophagia bacterium]|nr:formylglycine-generating enzyme family protein [Chitinophagia bacterium]
QTHPVKQLAANALGLYDMSGNVWEWCSDAKRTYDANPQTNPIGTGSLRVNRGGSCYNGAASCRSASRLSTSPSYRNIDLGFRLALAARR